ncbi:RNA-binding KH domain-containing protein [Abeliophyllum distichum]|uniref:RNA-binding KH domain-containing protein n=1 Tax=Abeliophyllum distichum TaxID=126358 RepID=A0ABD1QFJ1_9LAMI
MGERGKRFRSHWDDGDNKNQKRRADREREVDDKDKKSVSFLFQLPSSQSANIIGKSGVTIKKLRSKTRTNIKVTAKDASDPTHSCAFEFDNIVLISGDSEGVNKALFAICAIMYKFTPKENIPLETSVPEALPSIIIPSDVPIYPATGLYPSVDPIVTSRSVPSTLGPRHVPDIPVYADAGSTLSVYSSAFQMGSGSGGVSRPEELSIKDSGARVEVEDPKVNHNDCVITVISTESLDDMKSMAVEAVLLLQGKINDEDVNTVTMRLLLPSKVIGSIIGRSGSIINEIRKRTKADIRISKGEKPKCANDDDELVEVVGEVDSLRDALIQIVLRLRDGVLKDREGGCDSSSAADPLYFGGADLSVPPVLPSVSPAPHMGYEHRAKTRSVVDLLPSSTYGYGSLPMRENGYGSLSSHSSSFYGGLPLPSTLEIIVPADAVGKVMGKGGINLENIRKISGAAIGVFRFQILPRRSCGSNIRHI